MKTTIKQQRAEKQADLLCQVSQLTGLTINKLNEMIFNHGVEYMEKLGELSIVQAFIQEPIYWEWWRQQWSLIDKQFIESKALHHKAIYHYESLHRQIDVYPDKLVFEQIHRAYDLMSQTIIKKQKHQQDAV